MRYTNPNSLQRYTKKNLKNKKKIQKKYERIRSRNFEFCIAAKYPEFAYIQLESTITKIVT